MKRIWILALLLPTLALAAVVYETTYIGAVLKQGTQDIATYPSEAECVAAAKTQPVSATTTFECLSRTQVIATVTEDPPTDTDGDGIADDADQCPMEVGPAPLGCPVIATATKFVTADGGATSCSASIPCSLQHAANTSVAGDVILVAPGNYGPLNITRSGTLTQPIEYRGSGATIENPNGYGIYLKRVSYVTLDGFKVQNCKLKCVAAREATATVPVHGLTIRNLTITNGRQEGMYLSQVADSLIENNSITNVGLDMVETTGHGIYLANAGSDGTSFRRNIIMIGVSRGAAIHINGDEGQGGDGVVSNLTIDSNILEGGIKGISGDGLQDSLILNNLIYNARQHGIRAYRYDAAAGPKGLVIVNNTSRRAQISGYGSGLKISDARGPNTVFNNILVGSDTNYYGTGALTSNNLNTWAVDAEYHPLAAAKDKGIATFEGVTAPVRDLAGTQRDAPPSIGAFE